MAGAGLFFIYKLNNMEITFDKKGSNWNKEITAKEIFERQLNVGHFLLNNQHPIIEELKPLLLGKYRMIVKFIDQGYNNTEIWVSKTLCYRTNKFKPVSFTKGVKLIEGTPLPSGGSNSWPRPSFKEGYCILEFICHGFPCTKDTNGWKTEIISMEKL